MVQYGEEFMKFISGLGSHVSLSRLNFNSFGKLSYYSLSNDL